jgi:hypothetical protein
MGLFIFINIFIQIRKINEKFTCSVNNDISPPVPSNIPSDIILPKDSSILPFSDYKFMLLTTIDKTKISNSDQKWYDCNVNVTNIITSQNNNSLYFNYNAPISFIKNPLNIDGIDGVNIQNISLKGPLSYNFSNNTDRNDYTINSFSVFFTIKINNITPNTDNILFEMIGNTNSYNSVYEPSSININLLKNVDNTYKINITIGNIVFNNNLTNITPDLLLNTNPNFIGLIFNKNNIIFILNNNTYTFKNTYKENIILGTSNVSINKYGNIDAILYHFVYYKKDLSISDIALFKPHINYYISGLYIKDKLTKNQQDKIKDLEKVSVSNTDLQDKLNKCINTKDNIPNIPILNLQKINLSSMDPMPEIKKDHDKNSFKLFIKSFKSFFHPLL